MSSTPVDGRPLVLWVRGLPPSSSRAIATFAGTLRQLRTAVVAHDGGREFSTLVLDELGTERAVSIEALARALGTLAPEIEGRAAELRLHQPRDPEDPARSSTGDDDELDWYLFTQGARLVADLQSLAAHLEKLTRDGATSVRMRAVL